MLLRAIAMSMVLIETTVLCIFTESWPMPLALSAIAALGLFPRFQFDPSRDHRVILGLLLSLPFLLWYVLYLANANIDTTLLGSNMGVLMAEFFLGLQVMQFFFRHRDGMPPILPLFGVVTLTFAGDRTFMGNQVYMKDVYFGFALAYAALSTAYYSKLHPRLASGEGAGGRRKLLVGLCLLLTVGLAWSTARFIEIIRDPVNQKLGEMILPRNKLSLGNKDVASLGSIPKFKKNQGEKIALHVVAEDMPGYLRSRLFDECHGREWHYHGTQSRVGARIARPPDVPEYDAPGPYFQIAEGRGGASEKKTVEVYPERGIVTAMHTPDTTVWVSKDDRVLLVDELGVPESAQNLDGQRYVAYAQRTPHPQPMGPEDWLRFTQMPEELNPDIRALARDICAGLESPAEKAMAVTQYFKDNYKYDLGIQVPPGEDPLDYFLFSTPLPAAHCEFFASASALLLRAVGVPSRYVTGVLAWEQSKIGDYWVARNRDAHAWVEAFISEDGAPGAPGVWRVVEATPSDGLPQADEERRGGPISNFIDALRFQMARLIGFIKRGDWLGGLRAVGELLLMSLRWLLFTWTGWLCICLAAYPLWRRAKSRGWFAGRVQRRRVAPEISALWKLLHRADTTMMRWGLEREDSETLDAFAGRAEAQGARDWAEWYRDYGRLRYGAALNSEAVEALGAALPERPPRRNKVD